MAAKALRALTRGEATWSVIIQIGIAGLGTLVGGILIAIIH